MKLHRFITSIDLNKKHIGLDQKDLVHQIRNVLKLKVGEFFILGNGEELETIARIESFEKNKINLSLGEVMQNKNEPKVKSHLFCSVLKKENFEWVVEKATEIGISSITPIIATRTVKTNLSHERLLKITKEAAEQSGRGIIPKINEIIPLKDAIIEAQKLEHVIVFDLRGKQIEIKDGIKEIAGFIGPEGGFDDEELLLFQGEGFKIINLGPLTMRGETSAAIASYLITYPK
ncbi:hypothetical protein A2645_02260 [Candidatus Nomurabacteria bacterium RIFCSPHIGHO2_01_FULL_39_9]|uniref:Ribosomal RNA small subunit methyltransferase E n=1 Tax=Candidatus Nomurabacteria bacterium RIFCSPHIGHO2_01_FULL_39_9 TaxID=1801735 RepID=A0A1F6UUW5_9BACT|nr:MAG: hypothetical protein A2645_02260 [Candidatus Nomurabacteria bacterium RIFCSPHIGHO2_01_FULL_39_9]